MELIDGGPVALLSSWELEGLGRAFLRAKDAPGDVIECGTYQGGTLHFLARLAEATGTDCRILGYDTFAGLPETESETMHKGKFRAHLSESQRAFLDFRNVALIKGHFPDSSLSSLVRFAHLDLLLRSSTELALEHLKERMTEGSCLAVCCPGAELRATVREFAEESKNLFILEQNDSHIFLFREP